jgi:hypothetical protein
MKATEEVMRKNMQEMQGDWEARAESHRFQVASALAGICLAAPQPRVPRRE